jgi:fucose permease
VTTAEHPSAPLGPPGRSRVGIIILFLLMGIISGGFASRLPAVKESLHLSAGTLGLVLLGPAFGLILSTPVTGMVLKHLAPRRWILVGLAPFCFMLPLAALTHRPLLFFAALLTWGVGLGCVDVSLSTEATRVEARIGRRIMSGLHGAYSVGALAGAGIGALAALGGLTPKVQWTVEGGLALAVGLFATSLLPATFVSHHDVPIDDGFGHPARAASPLKLSWPLVALAFICFASLLSEGAASDWSTVYLHTSLGASPAVAILAYAGFEAAMVIGRLSGDRLTTRFGPVRLVRIVAVLGAVGLGAGLAVGNPIVAIVGFTLLGVGLSVSFPLAITRASGLGTAGPTVAVVTSCGYLGMLSGPAIIGGLASIVSLPVALGLVAALCALLAVLAGTLRSAPSAPSDGRSEPATALALDLLS